MFLLDCMPCYRILKKHLQQIMFMYIYLNAVFPDLGLYIVLINAVLKRGAIITDEVKSVQIKAVAFISRWSWNSKWSNRCGKMMRQLRFFKILRDMVDEVGYPFGNELINQKQFSITFSPTLQLRFPVMNRMTKKGLKSLKKSQTTLYL